MTDEQIDDLVNLNVRLLTMTGFASAIIRGLIQHIPHELEEEEQTAIDWLFKAVEEVIYRKKPLPPMP